MAEGKSENGTQPRRGGFGMQKAFNDELDPVGAEPTAIAWRGIELCRDGDWKEGLYWLSLAAGAKDDAQAMPSLFYSYLGYGIARYQNQRRQGLKLCQHSVEMEFYQPENYYYLAKTCLLVDDRRLAIDALDRGLQVDSSHRELIDLRRELGNRKPPVLPFLARTSFLNRFLGKMRHQVSAGKSRTPATE